MQRQRSPEAASVASSESDEDVICLEAAAYVVTGILTDENIPHLFIGGYAVSLLSRLRTPKDIDVLVQRDCTEILLRTRQFYQTSDNRLVYHQGGTNIFIDIMWPEKNRGPEFSWIWKFPWPGTSTEEFEVLSERGFPVPILHPTVLILTKILPWYAAENNHPRDFYRNPDTDLTDIMILLKWLSEKGLKINFNFFFQMPTRELIKAFGGLFLNKHHKYMRGYLAQCLPAGILRDVLNQLGDRIS